MLIIIMLTSYIKISYGKLKSNPYWLTYFFLDLIKKFHNSERKSMQTIGNIYDMCVWGPLVVQEIEQKLLVGGLYLSRAQLNIKVTSSHEPKHSRWKIVFLKISPPSLWCLIVDPSWKLNVLKQISRPHLYDTWMF